MDPELKQIFSGEIPWTVDGYIETNVYMNDLMKKPLDDWPIRPMGDITIEDYGTISFNQRHPLFQVNSYLMDKYGGRDGLAHATRLFAIFDFLRTHRDRLFADGLVKTDVAHGDMIGICDELLQVLVRLKFRRNGGFSRKAVYLELEKETTR